MCGCDGRRADESSTRRFRETTVNSGGMAAVTRTRWARWAGGRLASVIDAVLLQPVNRATMSPAGEGGTGSSPIFHPMEYGKCEPTTIHSQNVANCVNAVQKAVNNGDKITQENDETVPTAILETPEAADDDVPEGMTRSGFGDEMRQLVPCGPKKLPPCGAKHAVGCGSKFFDRKIVRATDSGKTQMAKSASNADAAGEALSAAIRAALADAKREAQKISCDPSCPSDSEGKFNWLKAFVVITSAADNQGTNRAAAIAYAQFQVLCPQVPSPVTRNPPDPPPPESGGGTFTPPLPPAEPERRGRGFGRGVPSPGTGGGLG